MKYLSLLMILMILFSCGEDSADEKEAVITPGEPEITGIIWEEDYRCPVSVEPAMRYEDEEGYSTIADSSLAVEIFNAVREGKVKVYDQAMKPLSGDEARLLLTYIKSTTIPGENNEIIEVVDTLNVAPEQVVEILAQENWVLEEGTFALRKNVKAYAPVVPTYDHEGNVRGKRILFWIKNP